MQYNADNGIIPTTILKSKEAILEQTMVADSKPTTKGYYVEPETYSIAADPLMAFMNEAQIKKLIVETRSKMEGAAKDLDFLQAARYRDELRQLEERLLETEKSGQ